MACGHTIHYGRRQETTGDDRRRHEFESSQVHLNTQMLRCMHRPPTREAIARGTMRVVVVVVGSYRACMSRDA